MQGSAPAPTMTWAPEGEERQRQRERIIQRDRERQRKRTPNTKHERKRDTERKREREREIDRQRERERKSKHQTQNPEAGWKCVQGSAPAPAVHWAPEGEEAPVNPYTLHPKSWREKRLAKEDGDTAVGSGADPTLNPKA